MVLEMFFGVQLLKSLPKQDFDIVWQVFQRNAYFVHVDNLLLAMVADTDEYNRRKAIQIITIARVATDRETPMIREFVIPNINIDAVDYTCLIDWDDDQLPITEPPALKSLSNDNLANLIVHPFIVPSIPCHSQSVERMVKLVTEVSRKAVGRDNRNKLIISTLNDRRKNPLFSSKCMYNV